MHIIYMCVQITNWAKYVINIMAKSNLRKKDLFQLTVPGHSQSVREVGTETEAGTEAETLEGLYLLAHLTCFCSAGLLYSLGLHKDATVHRGLDPPTQRPTQT